MALQDFYKGKAALITGASSGIGKDLAILWASWGCKVALAARRKELLEETAAECRAFGVDAIAVSADVADRAAMERIRDDVLARWGFVDLIIGNAGVGGLNPGPQFDLDIHRRTVEINLIGLANTVVPFIPSMVERRTGVLRGHEVVNGWQEAARAHGEFFSAIRPACTFVEVKGLINPEWLVELEADCIADTGS